MCVHKLGILTLATKHDCWKAVGLALSLKRTTPNLPISVVCSSEIAKKIGSYFDSVIEECKDLRGWEHKLYLDLYSPFERTLFIDADVLIFKNLIPILNQWKGRSFVVRGNYRDSGISWHGIDAAYVLRKIGKDKLAFIDGAGHYYFEKPKCTLIFEKAREVMKNYSDFTASSEMADEDVMGIAMTILDIAPDPITNFVSRVCYSKKKSFVMDVVESRCEYIDKKSGNRVEPFLIHFLARGIDAPILYALELHRLFRVSGVQTNILWWIKPVLFKMRSLWWNTKKIVLNHLDF